MNLSLRNRISSYFIGVTAILTGILFLTIYAVVSDTVYRHLDQDLDLESLEVINSLVVMDNQFIFANPFEWNEREHGQIEVNPIFVQVTDTSDNILKKTGNLLEDRLDFNSSLKQKEYFNTQLSGAPTRQLQMPIKNPVGKTLGYLLIAMPLEESALVLENLKIVLLVAFPLVLIFLFSISRYIAGKSIRPINRVINTAEKITRENLEQRIDLPLHKDEIYTLTATINELLNRLQDAVLREKQFTADASHELRTPLSVIKGTLEVLIRKPREQEEYISKIKYCINEVDRISNLVEQLLILARYESGKSLPVFTKVNLTKSIEVVLLRLQNLIQQNQMEINFDSRKFSYIKADESMLEIILENIISNSIKYSDNSKKIDISIEDNDSVVSCNIEDYGTGLSKEQITRIFDRFYRADESRTSQIQGNGLGLAIVKRLADLQNFNINIESRPDSGTIFSLTF
ncbi:MAG TPA: ATP-binding protein [Ignavibacteriaceae bacterium]|nr:ATP-binding protein [Ignavibacteriaceae bacterium]